MDKGDTIYYARSVPSCNIYDVCELTVRTVAETYFAGFDSASKQAFIFNYGDDRVYQHRVDALNRVKEDEAKYGIRKLTKDGGSHYDE